MSIRIEHASERFGGQPALHDVSLEVREGELLALLGPSGSGKTTLLRIMAGLEAPDADPRTVIQFGQPGGNVGFVFQHYALFRTMTVFENVAFGLRVKPRKQRPPEAEIRRRVHELLALIQLDSMADRYPPQLSGGQRQRVALARALAIEPQILLLDEPFGALDAKVRQSLRRWLRRLHDDIKVTSVLVTHDQEEALEVADRVVIMNGGRIEQIGAPDEVFHRPASAFVMDFLGNVNLFHARMEDDRAARVLVRPHDLEISRQGSESAMRSRVVRVQTAGSLVKVEVAADTGESAVVELPHERYAELQLQRDDVVWVSMKQSRVFFEDYSI